MFYRQKRNEKTEKELKFYLWQLSAWLSRWNNNWAIWALKRPVKPVSGHFTSGSFIPVLTLSLIGVNTNAHGEQLDTENAAIGNTMRW